jgi:hypothetical protein
MDYKYTVAQPSGQVVKCYKGKRKKKGKEIYRRSRDCVCSACLIDDGRQTRPFTKGPTAKHWPRVQLTAEQTKNSYMLTGKTF